MSGGLINRDLATAMPNLRIISGNAFNRAFSAVSGQTTLTIPGSVITLGQNSLRYNGEPAYGITTLELGNDSAISQLSTLGADALQSGGSSPYELIIHTDNRSASIWTDVIANAGATNVNFVEV
jgi:hypothetical protein